MGENDGRVICARAEYVPDKPKDACSGDSGGPIYSSAGLNDQSDQKYLRGIVSIGSTKCGTVSQKFQLAFMVMLINIVNLFFFSFYRLRLQLKASVIRTNLNMVISLECTQRLKNTYPGF